MRLMQGVLLLGAVALGNPVAEIQERQAPAASACSTLAGRCTRVASLQSSASAFCSSLGFGTLINTVKTTVVVRRTQISTVTTTTGTTTFTAPTSTSTITSSRTSYTTITTNISRTSSITLFRSVTGILESCPGTTFSDVDSSSTTISTSSSTRATASSSATATTSSIIASSGSSTTSRNSASSSPSAGMSLTSASTRASTTSMATRSSATTPTINSAASTQSMDLGCANPGVTTMIYGSIASAYSYCIGARLLYPRPQDGKGDGYGVFVDSVDDCASRCTGACKAFNYDGAYGDSDKKFCEVMPTWTGASPSQPGSYYKTAYALRSTSTVTITSATIGATTGVGLTITATSGPATSARIPAGSSTTRTASSTSRSTTIQTVTSAATTQTSGLGCAVPSVTTFTENGIASTYDYCEGARLENDGPRDGFAQNLNDCAVRCTGGCKAFNYEPTYGDTDDWPRCQLVSTWSAVFPSQTGDYYRTAYSLRFTSIVTSTNAPITTATATSQGSKGSSVTIASLTATQVTTPSTSGTFSTVFSTDRCPTPTRIEVTTSSIVTAYDSCMGFMDSLDGSFAHQYGVKNVAECAARCTGSCVAFRLGWGQLLHTWPGSGAHSNIVRRSHSFLHRQYKDTQCGSDHYTTTPTTTTSANTTPTTTTQVQSTLTTLPTTSQFLTSSSMITSTASSSATSSSADTSAPLNTSATTPAITQAPRGPGCPTPTRTEITQTGIATLYDYCNAYMAQNAPVGNVYEWRIPRDACAARCTGGCFAFNYLVDGSTTSCQTITASVSTVRENEYSWRAYSQVGTRIVTGPEASATLDKYLGCANPSRTTFSQSQIATVYN